MEKEYKSEGYNEIQHEDEYTIAEIRNIAWNDLKMQMRYLKRIIYSPELRRERRIQARVTILDAANDIKSILFPRRYY